MIKLLLMGDRHNSQSIPKSRKDDFLETCEKKDAEIISLAIEHDVDAIIQPGDFWTDADHKLKNDFIAQVANKWSNIYSKDGRKIPLVGIAGNHDLIGENLSSYDVTTTGLLDALGIFRIISKNDPFVIEKDGKKLVVTGTSYHKGMDKPEFLSDYICDEHLGDYHIHVVHGMLTPRNMGSIIRHTKIDTILETKADITFCGHDHNGFGIINTNNKYFINPGAVVRLTASQEEITRTVGVVLVTIDDTINCELIPLKSALPGSSVLDRTALDNSERLEEFTKELKDKVEHLDIGKSISMDDILDEICTEQKIPDSLKDDIKKAIEKNANLTGTVSPTKKPPTDTHITEIKLKNFQSHADTTMTLGKNFNVILGESRQGKSAILRAIRWVVENKPSGKGFIRTGSEEASVEIKLANGTIIRRFANKKENGYKIFLPDGTIEEGNTKMVSRVQELMGYTNFIVDEKTSIPLNMLRQGDSWYLIGERYSSTDRARILGTLKNTNAADVAIKEYDKENTQIQSNIKKAEIDIANTQMEYNALTEALHDKELLLSAVGKRITIDKIDAHKKLSEELSTKTALVTRIDTCFNEGSIISKVQELKTLCDKLAKIKRYADILGNSKQAVQAQDDILNQLPDEMLLFALRDSLKTAIQKSERIVILSDTIAKESVKLKKAEAVLGRLSAVDESKVTVLKDAITRYATIKSDYMTIYKGRRTIHAADKFIGASDIVDTFSAQKYELMGSFERLNKVRTLQARLTSSQKELSQREVAFTNADKALEDAMQAKVDILAKSHICPTCYSEIDEQTLYNMIDNMTNKSEEGLQ